jgi:hypothetical protein
LVVISRVSDSSHDVFSRTDWATTGAPKLNRAQRRIRELMVPWLSYITGAVINI